LGDYRELFSGVADPAAAQKPEPAKWSAKEILGHVCDTERIMSYRALRFARGDAQELKGFDQDNYVREANFNARSLSDLLTEFESVRKSTIALLGSVRALAYVIAGHAQHHLERLRACLKAQVSPG
jgi:hypothetical protein